MGISIIVSAIYNMHNILN